MEVTIKNMEALAEILEHPERFLANGFIETKESEDGKKSIVISNKLIFALNAGAEAIRDRVEYLKTGKPDKTQEITTAQTSTQKDLVSREDVLLFIQDIKCNKDIPKNYGTLLDIMRYIRQLPTAAVSDADMEELQEFRALNMTPTEIKMFAQVIQERMNTLDTYQLAEKFAKAGDELISKSQAINALQEYAEQKHASGEIELANGILKAKCFLKNGGVPSLVNKDAVVPANSEAGIKWELATRLMECFDNSFINHLGEFIAHREANEYFALKSCRNELEVKCRVIEYLSRAAHKTQPFSSDRKNDAFNRSMLAGINKFLGTTFTEKDMDTIYTRLGNGCNHSLTIQFVNSDYDMSVLTD